MPSHDERKVSSPLCMLSCIPLPSAPETRTKKRMRKSGVKVAFAMQQWERFHSICKASRIPDRAFLAGLGWIWKSRLA